VDTNDTFSPPAIAANAFNNISHYNRFYFTLFEPAASPKWEGNVKPYALNDNFELVDADNNVAVDNSGFFLESSRSFWSATDDGASIAEGGANGQLPSATNRNLYTYTGNYSTTGIPDSPALSTTSNALQNSASLTADMLGLANPDAAALDVEFNNVLNTIRASTMGDPLHSRPTLVNYGGSASNPTSTLFVATNAGFLHALNASTGAEQFAFIPQELLTNLPALASSTGTHPYGLDGDVTAWTNDINNDGDVNDTGEHAYIYVGMRRGGNNYYALDVTNINAPTLKWVIKGGPAGNSDFAELGQSWSRPIVTTINYGSTTRTVLIFGGGYDTAQDANPINTDDNIGRAIYIVDADTGERLWWAGSTGSGANFELGDLTNSIPSDIKLLDSNLDGQTDRLYVGDMRGQVFRFDIQASGSGVTGSGVRLANFGGTDAANNRRFYYAPDVVVTSQPGVNTYISINIGSGYRAHPLNPASGTRVNDRFYSLRDPNVLGAAPSTTLTNNDLFDATSTLVATASDHENGWYITLGNGSGEKVLASAITINNEILFTTYTPPTNVAQSDCAPPPGVGQLYRVSLFDATPTRTSAIPDINGDLPDPTVADRVTILERPGIPSSPIIMYREIINADGTSGGVEAGPCVGTDCTQEDGFIQIQDTYWKNES
ncbi:MAG: pilus assembly protein PilY, partial [Gammaproteobacteria bacterium]|nr:pilus assembly protein PilY [Gammaproteobacteria bacterium]